MIRSMTGFGDAQGQTNGVHFAVEARAVNNRYFKASVRLPEEIAGLEAEIETQLRKRLSRGSITLVIGIRDDSADAAHTVNTAALNAYLEQVRHLAGDIDIATLLNAPRRRATQPVRRPPRRPPPHHHPAHRPGL